MPELNQTQSPREGQSFFANDGEDSGLPALDPETASEMEQNQTELKYGEHSVSLETLNFLEALEPQLGRGFIMENLDSGNRRIHLNEQGCITRFECQETPISYLPELPDSLQLLNCSNTEITTLPELKRFLIGLRCYETPLARDPQKRADLQEECREKGIQLTI